jgi:hypothetical protein
MIKKEELMSRQSDLNNHANQMNPNNDAYWQSRGEDERPDELGRAIGAGWCKIRTR